MDESSKQPTMREDPMVAQDKPANKMGRGILYGGIILLVLIAFWFAMTKSVKHSKETIGSDTTYSNSYSIDTTTGNESGSTSTAK